jgi:hypothetical protein
MTQSRIPGPLGQTPDADTLEPRSIGLSLRPGRRAPHADTPPGPVGLHVWNSPILAAPNTVAKAVNSGAGGKALIVVGTGHDDLKRGVRHSDDKHFNQAILDFFAPHTKGMDVTIKHVKSAKEMKQLIAGGSWDLVAYFGHGVVNQMALEPLERGARLSKDELVSALKQAKPSRVILMGCKAGWTGLGRQISTELPGVTVSATFESLDVSWEQGRKDGQNYNRLTPSEEFTDYKDGLHIENGQKAKWRKREQVDKLDPNGDPLGERVAQ